MAKLVIAGSSDCPHFSRIELLADHLVQNLPNFHLHKIVKQPYEWSDWLSKECSKNGWKHSNSPIVWRELVDRGGKGVLIGGANEFQEYANAYYGQESVMMSKDMRNVAEDNLRYKEAEDSEDRYFRSLSVPLRVCITNASNRAVTHLIPRLADGLVFGERTELSIVLHDSTERMESLGGFQMEIFDMSHQLIREITVTDNFEKAISGSAVVVLLDEIVQEEEESREDWLRRNAEHFTTLASQLDSICDIETKIVLAGGGPMNFCVYMMLSTVKRLQRYNIVALPRLLERQVKAVLASKMSVNSAGVTDLIVWGNPSGKCHIDLNRCRVYGYDGSIVGPPDFSLSTKDTVWDRKWLRTELMSLCMERTSKINEAKGECVTGGLALGNCLADFLRDWWNGSTDKQIFSLSVQSKGWYGIPEGLVFSFPVIFHPKGYWSVVEDMELTEDSYTLLNECVQELVAEKEVIFPTAPAETESSELLGSSFAPTALEPAKETKTPMEQLEVVVADRYPEHVEVLKTKLLGEATADELVQWVENLEVFHEKIKSVLEDEDAGGEKEEGEKAGQSSDEMMTAGESDGARITDDEAAAAAAAEAAMKAEEEAAAEAAES